MMATPNSVPASTTAATITMTARLDPAVGVGDAEAEAVVVAAVAIIKTKGAANSHKTTLSKMISRKLLITATTIPMMTSPLGTGADADETKGAEIIIEALDAMTTVTKDVATAEVHDVGVRAVPVAIATRSPAKMSITAKFQLGSMRSPASSKATLKAIPVAAEAEVEDAAVAGVRLDAPAAVLGATPDHEHRRIVVARAEVHPIVPPVVMLPKAAEAQIAVDQIAVDQIAVVPIAVVPIGGAQTEAVPIAVAGAVVVEDDASRLVN